MSTHSKAYSSFGMAMAGDLRSLKRRSLIGDAWQGQAGKYHESLWHNPVFALACVLPQIA